MAKLPWHQYLLQKNPLPQPAQVWLTIALLSIGQVAFAPLVQTSFYRALLGNQILIVLGLPILVSLFLHADFVKLFPRQRMTRSFLFWLLLLALSFDVALEYIVWLSEFYLPLPQNIVQDLDQLMSVSSANDFAFKLVLLCLLPACTEEMCFRGFVQTSFTAHRGTLYALVATTLIFAILHANPWYFHIYLMLGLWFGWLRLISASLVPSILSHFFNNAWTLSLHAAHVQFPLFPGRPVYDFVLFLSASLLTFWSMRKLWSFTKDSLRI